jgi:Tol biopolymer transport system component/DNA-binding winged helix-turn-helix (wHTH) protein
MKSVLHEAALRTYQFGPFRLIPQRRLLISNGKPVDIGQKSLELLVILVEQAGQVVSKKELMERLWPDTFVEENNLAQAVSSLRQVLADDSDSPEYVKTIPRRGYMFAFPVSEIWDGHLDAPKEIAVVAPISAARVPVQSRLRRLMPLFIAALTVGLFAIYWATLPSPPPRILSVKPLTSDRRGGKFLWSPILSDGWQLYFVEHDANRQGAVSVSARGGNTTPLNAPFPITNLLDISRGEPELLFRSGLSVPGPLWAFPVPMGIPRRIGDVVASTACWSPDRSRIAYAVDRDISISDAQGRNSHKLATAEHEVSWLRWSPDGNVLRFTAVDQLSHSLWEVPADGSLPPHQLFPGWHHPSNECCGNWTPDGRYFVFKSPAGAEWFKAPGWWKEGTNIWVIQEKGRFLQRLTHQPMQLTSGPMNFSNPSISPDGKQIFATGDAEVGELDVWEARRNQFVPYLAGISATWVAFSRDARRVAYTTYPERALWIVRPDGSEPRQLTFPLAEIDGVTFSPDGSRLVFRARKVGRPYKIYTLPIEVGEPQEVIPRRLIPEQQEEGIASWSPDGTKIVFGDVPATFGGDKRKHQIRIFDLTTGELTALPGSDGLWTARWSPDGQYISALTITLEPSNRQKLMLYDLNTRTWRETQADHVDNPTWSHDGEYIYFDREDGETYRGIFRVKVSDGKMEQVANFSNLQRIAPWWSGLTPDDSPLILRDTGIQEIYALEVEWP